VLRLRPGEAVTASDGAGRWRTCRFLLGGRLEATGPVRAEPTPFPAVSVGFALLKGDHNEWVVQKLTELGVDRLLPFVAERSVVRWDPGSERALRQAERWRVVAREAAMQSRRVKLAVVEEVRTFAEVVAPSVASGAPGMALAEPGGAVVSLHHPVVLVGPEGGWSSAELASGLPTVDLGPTVLKAETAAITVAALVCALRRA